MSLNKTVIITGASSGIGLGLVKAFLGRGYNVVGNARSPSGLEAAAAQLGHPAGFIGVAGDIADPATSTALIAQAVEAFGAVDGLVNNAGFFLPKPFVEYSPQDLDALLDTNLKGLVYASQAAAAHHDRAPARLHHQHFSRCGPAAEHPGAGGAASVDQGRRQPDDPRPGPGTVAPQH